MDIVQQIKVARYLHSDMPLGNPLGMPGDREMQMRTVREALSLLGEATEPEIRRASAQWLGDPGWRDDYSKVDDSNREELAQRGEARRAQQEADRAAGKSRASMIPE